MSFSKKNDEDEVVVRDSQLAAFFFQRPFRDLAKSLGAVFDDWLGRTPEEAKKWALIGPDADEAKPFGPKLLPKAKAQLDPVRAKSRDMAGLEVWGPEETNPTHAFAFDAMNDLQNDETNLLELRAPSAEVDAAHVERYVEVIRHVAEQVPYDSGYASPALTHPSDRPTDFVEPARKWAFRHPGLDMPNNDGTNSGIGRKVRGAYWLTFLGPWALKQLGGAEALKKALPKEAEVHGVGVGVMIRAGRLPSLGDVNKGDNVPLLRAVAKVIEPVTLFGDSFLDTIFRDEDERARWERRHLD
jgi:hypothetical protein